jgi:hypothetical protein
MSVYPGAGLPRPDLTEEAHAERHRDEQERAHQENQVEGVRAPWWRRLGLHLRRRAL